MNLETNLILPKSVGNKHTMPAIKKLQIRFRFRVERKKFPQKGNVSPYFHEMTHDS